MEQWHADGGEAVGCAAGESDDRCRNGRHSCDWRFFFLISDMELKTYLTLFSMSPTPIRTSSHWSKSLELEVGV